MSTEIVVRCLTHPGRTSPTLASDEAAQAWEASHLAWSMRRCTLVRDDLTQPEPAEAAEAPPTSARMEITPADVDGVIVGFRHALGTPRVLVKAYAGDAPIGYGFANVIDDNEVEVSIVDGTTALTAEALPDEDEEQTDA